MPVNHQVILRAKTVTAPNCLATPWCRDDKKKKKKIQNVTKNRVAATRFADSCRPECSCLSIDGRLYTYTLYVCYIMYVRSRGALRFLSFRRGVERSENHAVVIVYRRPKRHRGTGVTTTSTNTARVFKRFLQSDMSFLNL